MKTSTSVQYQDWHVLKRFRLNFKIKIYNEDNPCYLRQETEYISILSDSYSGVNCTMNYLFR